ncbi:putative ribonuclease H protein [Senna tora]|uniref:Putative ribonuclease H protein n=1 Tax=Senna tora TaxID=362788 RepID=A0A835CBX8_9FABA|nr:putative ribonuclease H protein [Senna tora]
MKEAKPTAQYAMEWGLGFSEEIGMVVELAVRESDSSWIHLKPFSHATSKPVRILHSSACRVSHSPNVLLKPIRNSPLSFLARPPHELVGFLTVTTLASTFSLIDPVTGGFHLIVLLALACAYELGSSKEFLIHLASNRISFTGSLGRCCVLPKTKLFLHFHHFHIVIPKMRLQSISEKPKELVRFKVTHLSRFKLKNDGQCCGLTNFIQEIFTCSQSLKQ